MLFRIICKQFNVRYDIDVIGLFEISLLLIYLLKYVYNAARIFTFFFREILNSTFIYTLNNADILFKYKL